MNREIKYKINRISLFLLHTFLSHNIWNMLQKFGEDVLLRTLKNPNTICCYNSNRFINICPKILYLFRNTLKIKNPETSQEWNMIFFRGYTDLFFALSECLDKWDVELGRIITSKGIITCMQHFIEKMNFK